LKDPDVASLLESFLNEEGVVCDVSSTAQGARTLLASRKYNLLLLDLTLPDTDGLDLLHELREDVATERLPVLGVSGRALEGRRAALDANALSVVDWIQKPVDRRQLARALEIALERQSDQTRILHVEDDPDIVALVADQLEGFARVVLASTRAEAETLLKRGVFDLVILDLTLGDGSGADLLKTIGARCPVVIFSAQAPVAEVSQAVEAALTKGKSSSKEFLEVVKRAATRRRGASA
jgi:DNA-binding response OmpR family regulator